MRFPIDLDVVEQIYDVPLGAGDWEQVIVELRRRYRAECGILLSYAHGSGNVQQLSLSGADESAWRRYHAHYGAIDPLLGAIHSGAMRAGIMVSGEQVMPRRALKRTEFYNGFWRVLGFGDTAGAYMTDAHGRRVLIALPRLRDAGAYRDSDLVELQLYFNHIARGLALQQLAQRRRARPDLDALGRRYQLTAAELRLIDALLDTGSLRKAARRVCRSYNTLRVQLRSILKKTGARSQVDLMSRILAP